MKKPSLNTSISLLTVLTTNVVPIGALGAQPVWRNIDDRSGHAFAVNLLNNTALLFGGDNQQGASLADTWRRTPATAWLPVTTTASPSARTGHAMAYSAALNRTILFGGTLASAAKSDQTWTWDGVSWGQGGSPTAPSARSNHAMVYHAASQKVLMFGGFDNITPLADTWTYDGTTWQALNPASPPSARFGHAMAYDPVRGFVVMFGGSGNLADTWIYDIAANAWVQRLTAAANTPPGRKFHGMAWDNPNAQIVLFGGSDANQNALNDTWTWDWNVAPLGGWKQRASGTITGRSEHAMQARPGANDILLYGGKDTQGRKLGDTWRWNGAQWVASAPPPDPRNASELAFDSNRSKGVLFGGTLAFVQGMDDTWEYDAKTGLWARILPPASPPPRFGHGLAYLASTTRCVMFGGYHNGLTRNDTWEWDGSNWTQRSSPTSPAPTLGARLSYDSHRDKVVFYGGVYGVIDETWEYDSSGWTRRLTNSPPGGKYSPVMAYDAARQQTVLYDGTDGKVWLWNGTSWTAVTPVNQPGVRQSASMAYDEVRQRIVLFGGSNSGQNYGSTWEWDGTNWSLRQNTGTPGARSSAGMGYDSWNQQCLLFGGSDTSGPLVGTWSYGSPILASAVPFGVGCLGSINQPPALESPRRPWLGELFVSTITKVPPAAAAVALFGLSNTQWGSLPLPFDLRPIGMPGCYVYQSNNLSIPFLAGVVAIGVPNSPELIGNMLHEQAVVVDPGANLLGLTTSNALTLTFGAR